MVGEMLGERLGAVLVDFDGAPVSFDWRSNQYLVNSRPVRWYSRTLWWDQAKGVPKGAGVAALEIEMWRLWAASPQGSIFFELKHDRINNSWEISQLGS
jgi:hypothetical protein